MSFHVIGIWPLSPNPHLGSLVPYMTYGRSMALYRRMLYMMEGSVKKHQESAWYLARHVDMYWLVVWNIFLFSHSVGNFIIPIDFHIFQRGGPTTHQCRNVWPHEVERLLKCGACHSPCSACHGSSWRSTAVADSQARNLMRWWFCMVLSIEMRLSNPLD